MAKIQGTTLGHLKATELITRGRVKYDKDVPLVFILYISQ